MPRGIALSELVDQVRYEVRDAAEPALGSGSTERIKHMLRRTQQRLYDEYDWPMFRVMPVTVLNVGQRYYDMPADLNLERVEAVRVYDGSVYNPITRGIGYSQYSVHDSDADERSSPPARWDVRWTGSAEQIEVWPIPSDSIYSLRWTGLRPLRPLVADADVADLDDQVLTMYVAAEILAAFGAKDAQAKAELANQRLQVLKGRVKGASDPVIVGGGVTAGHYRSHDPLRVEWDAG